MLRILRGAGPAGLPTLDIAARMIEHSPGITRLLDRLEARRLVRRVRCPEDRRQVLCHATPVAARLLSGLDAPVAEAGRRCLDPLDPARTAALLALDAVRATTTSAASADSRAPKTRRTTQTKEKR